MGGREDGFEGSALWTGSLRPDASNRLTPCTPSFTAPESSVLEAEPDWEGCEYARSIPLLTMRSHLRLSWASSASWTASWERSSRHLDSFWAMNCKRSACLVARKGAR